VVPTANDSFSGVNTFKTLNALQLADQYSATDPSVGIANASAALPATGGIVDARGYGCANYSLTQEIDVGNSSFKPVTLLLPNCGTWTATMTGGTAYGLKVFNKSQAIGPGTGEGQAFTIQAGAASNLDSVCGSDPAIAGASYVRMEGFTCSAASGATVANAVLHITKLFDESYVGHMAAITQSSTASKVLWIHRSCCSARLELLNAEGNNIANAVPCTFGETGTNQAGVDVYSVSCVHPGTGKSNLALVQSGQGGFNYYSKIYAEVTSSDLTTPVIAVTGGSGVPDTIDGVALGVDVASSTRYLIDIVSGNRACDEEPFSGNRFQQRNQ